MTRHFFLSLMCVTALAASGSVARAADEGSSKKAETTQAAASAKTDKADKAGADKTDKTENAASSTEDTAAKQKTIDEQAKTIHDQNPYLEKLRKASIDFIKDVPEDGVKPLLLIRQSYGIVQSVHAVIRDVGDAVKQCGDANADMNAPMDKRYASWKSAVTKELDVQDKKLNAAIDAQSYKKPADFRAYLKIIDDAAAYADKRLDKQVVTTPEACQSLMKSMDGTQKNIVSLLGQTPIPEFNADGKYVDPAQKEDKTTATSTGKDSKNDAEKPAAKDDKSSK